MPTVLVVDDLEELLSMMRRYLRFFGYDVITAATAARAMRARRPDVAVIDYHMPDMDGVTLAGVLRERFPGLPILFYSAGMPADAVARANLLGAVIPKGGAMRDLLDAIDAALSGVSVPLRPSITEAGRSGSSS